MSQRVMHADDAAEYFLKRRGIRISPRALKRWALKGEVESVLLPCGEPGFTEPQLDGLFENHVTG